MKKIGSALNLLGFVLWGGALMAGGMAITAKMFQLLVRVASTHWLKGLPQVSFGTVFLMLLVIVGGVAAGFAFNAIMQGIASKVIGR